MIPAMILYLIPAQYIKWKSEINRKKAKKGSDVKIMATDVIASFKI